MNKFKMSKTDFSLSVAAMHLIIKEADDATQLKLVAALTSLVLFIKIKPEKYKECLEHLHEIVMSSIGNQE